ncbi:DNRLRE domain-containing protein [Streptomyces sp. LHD-70]|uniref:DNRLRE domain-containing protein n=1 Tax=Streptomyces sp. LHD-70 TaxID=3072140 RepID=UPI00281056A6|nr:DNRLRE domain-containing protein [Streptomyces sp. LHD-70]MDQ8704866.1 DNRLRE domain-containing protein [Streptomyces sp. LHD-70]
MTAGPERIERGGKWVPVDASFHKTDDGKVKAKAHPTGLTLAGGSGTRAKSIKATADAAPRDLVTLGGEDGEQVTLQWKGGLPTPKLDGTTATYNNAVPGADVIVEATRTGFEQYTRLKERPSGPYTYTLPLKADGLKAKANADGSVTFTDSKTGAKKATMPAPVMWDASVDKISGKHENRHRVGMKVIDHGSGDIDLVVTPDAKWLADKSTRYPVTIDPSTSALGNTFDTYVQRGETTDLGSETELDWGNPGTKNSDGTTRIARSLMTWNTEPFADALISSAKVEFYNFHSGNTDCQPHAWDVWGTTAGSSASRWTAQPDWLQKYASSTETKGNAMGCSSTEHGWIKADVQSLVQTWASAKQTRGHMGVRAAEDSALGWKRVNSRNATTNQPKLTVNYNYRPGDGAAQQAGPPFESYQGVWGVNTLTPTLRDKFTDADGDTVSGSFQVYDAATNQPITTPAGDGVIVSDYVTPGDWASVQVPAGQLVDGKTYKFRTNAYDGTHYNLNWSPWREFVVETAAAGQPTNLQPGDSYTISDRALLADPAKVVEVFKRDGNLEALGVKPTRGPSAPTTVQTMADWERSYTIPSTKFTGGRKPADQYDYIASVEECSNADDADNVAGYIKNRFSYCQETLTVMPAIKCGLFPPGCYLQGEFIATNTLIGMGKIGGRDGSDYTRYAEFDLNVDVHWVGGDFKKTGAKMKASLPCEGEWNTGNPGADPNYACYSGIYEEREVSPTQWDVDGDTKFDLWSSTPKLPSVDVGEQIAEGKFTPTFDFTLPGYGQFIPSEGEEGQIRFDSAAYLTWGKVGSVFPDATPALRYDKSDTSRPGPPAAYTGVAAVAQHIDDARKNPGSTVPQKADKKLPGAEPLDPLHRLVSSQDETRYDANRNVVTSLCNSGAVPGGPAAGKDCDEYPFASTTEGAARYKYEGDQYKDDFSARYIDSSENQEAGSRLGAWYQNDRILHWESFVISIGA